MQDTKQYSIGELAELTGVSRRTVRFYVQRGLIPPPQGLGRGRHYTAEHLELILKIRELQRDGILLGQAVNVLSAGPEPAPAVYERELVTRIKLHPGVWLEFEHGVRIPTPQLLDQVRKILKPVI